MTKDYRGGPATSWYEDTDMDSYGGPATKIVGDLPDLSWVTDNTDCDDTNGNANPGELEIADLVDNDCDTLVDNGFRYAFVTSSESFGSLGGLSGADQICDDLAAATALPEGDYAAWLSSSTEDAKNRVTDNQSNTSTYVNTDGAIIANDFEGLIGGTILEPIEVDESGNSVGGFAWIGTDPFGIKMDHTCNDWGGGGGACYGSATTTTSSWSLLNVTACDQNERHYCIQK